MAIAATAAGCSSGTMRFQDGLFTSSTASAQYQTAATPPMGAQQQAYGQPQTYTPPQNYPATAQAPAGVDTTYTGSISRQAVQPAGIGGQSRRPGTPVPSVNVGNQPMPQVAAAARQPFPTPAAPAARGTVTRQPAPAIASAPLPAPKGVDNTVTGSIAPRGALPQPKAAAGKTAGSLGTLTLPGEKAPQPSKAPLQHVAVLPETQRLNEKQARGEAANAKSGKDAPTTGSVYTVQSGDTLSSIARKLGTSTSEIKQANGLNSALLRIGQKLVVPGAKAQPQVVASAKAPDGVDPIVTGSSHADTKPTQAVDGYTPPRKDDKGIEQAVEQQAAAPDATGIGRMRWPVRGRVVAGFKAQSDGKPNDGIDIAVPEGTPIKAAENGIVIYAGDGLKDFGKTVLVRHEDGLVTVYGHASEIEVERGATVHRGQEIARSGLTGNADSPKLHFEVRKNSTPVDPTKYLE